MTKITVVCREEEYEQNILIYVVDVEDANNEVEVQRAVQIERGYDIPPDEVGEMEILFAFAGELSPIADWRD